MHEEAANLPLGWLTHTQQAPGGKHGSRLNRTCLRKAGVEEKGGGGREGRNMQVWAT